jgi:hypothetical protein
MAGGRENRYASNQHGSTQQCKARTSRPPTHACGADGYQIGAPPRDGVTIMSENEVRIDHKRDVLRLPNGVDMVTVTCHGYSQPTQIILSRSEPNCPGSRLTLRVETLRKAADLAASNGTVVHIPITTRGRVENFGVYAFHKLETHIFVGPFTSKNE